MDTRSAILAQLKSTVDEFTYIPFPTEVNDEMELDQFGLDSVAFTGLLIGLEEQFGFIPSDIIQSMALPKTFGNLVEAYENENQV